MKDMGNLVAIMLQTASILRLHHWHPTEPGKPGSNAEHEALGEMYEYLNDKVDIIVESYQGEYGLIDVNIPKVTREIAAIKAVDIMCEILETACKSDNYPAWIINELQEIQVQMYKGKYKLVNLK